MNNSNKERKKKSVESQLNDDEINLTRSIASVLIWSRVCMSVAIPIPWAGRQQTEMWRRWPAAEISPPVEGGMDGYAVAAGWLKPSRIRTKTTGLKPPAIYFPRLRLKPLSTANNQRERKENKICFVLFITMRSCGRHASSHHPGLLRTGDGQTRTWSRHRSPPPTQRKRKQTEIDSSWGWTVKSTQYRTYVSDPTNWHTSRAKREEALLSCSCAA